MDMGGVAKSLSLLMVLTLLISGCIDNLPTQQTPTCNSPYILVGASCCLDQNSNNICDSDETAQSASSYQGEVDINPTIPPTTPPPKKPDLRISTQVTKSVTPFSSGELLIEISNYGNDRAVGVNVDISGTDIQSQLSENLYIDEGSEITLSIPLTLTKLVPGQKSISVDVMCSNCDRGVSGSNIVYVNINPEDFLPKSRPLNSIIENRKCEKFDESGITGEKCEITYKIVRRLGIDKIGSVGVFVADSITSANRLDEELKSQGSYTTTIVRGKQIGFSSETQTELGGLISQTGYFYFWKTDAVVFIIVSNDNDMAMDLIYELPKM